MLYVHGVGHFHPENVIDNAFLESLDIGTNDEWIVSRVGIKTRRTVLELDYIKRTKNQDLRQTAEATVYKNGECGRRAAAMAIERAGIQANDIGLVIGGSSSPEFCIPTEAAATAKLLGIEAPCVDIASACTTFGAHLHFAASMGASLPDYVLSVVPENTTRVTNFADRSSAILFGDATAATVLSTKHPARMRAIETTFGGAPSGAFEVVIPRLGHFYQNGSAVQKFAIKTMTELTKQIQARLSSEGRPRMIYIGHQANLTMLESVVRRCEVPADCHYFNIDAFGNQAAAGAPAVISQNWDRFKKGDVVGCVVVGSGLSWSSVQLEWS